MPDWRPELRERLSNVRLAPAREAEIIEELSQHLEDRFQELVASGTAPEEAARAARAAFSGDDVLARYLAPLRQAHWHDPAPASPRRWYAFGGLLTDLRDAIRSLRSTPGFTAVALIVLTLGMGATTAIFSVVDAVALRPLPFEAPEALVAVGERAPATGPSAKPPRPGDDPAALRVVQPQNYLDWAAQQHVFSGIAAVATGEITFFPQGGDPETIVAQRVTGSFFDILRIRPAIGRTFASEAEVDGRHRVVVLSHALWRTRFAADPAVIGRVIAFDGGNYEVVGVLAAGVSYPVGADPATDVWMPLVFGPGEKVRGRGHSMYLHVIGRLAPGTSLQQARGGMDQVAAGIEQAYPDWNRGMTVGVRPLRDHLVGASTHSWMLMLLAAVGIVLLIACANVANLMLARASARESEVGIRAALGAGRWRLVRQFIVESLVLSIAGTVLAVVVASWLVEILRSAMPEGMPRVTTIGLNVRVLAAAAGVSILSGVLFGILPALQASRPNLLRSLNGGSRGASASRRRQRIRRALVVAEIALSVVLLVGAALFIGSFIRVMRIDTGVNVERVMTVRLTQQAVPGQPRPDWRLAFADIVQRLQRTSGVASVSAVYPAVPFRPWQNITGLATASRPMSRDSAINLKIVTPDYHRSLAIPLKRGRLFTDADRDGSEAVAILSESAARTFYGDADPVGHPGTLEGGAQLTIVGVVADVRQATLEGETMPEIYLPMTQRSVNAGYLVIRTTGDPRQVLPATRVAVTAVLPGVPLRDIAQMDERLARQTAPRRLNMLMLGLFGVLGLMISAVGLYGVMAYLVAQRTREIGVRMALGATRPQVIAMVVRNGGVMLAAGLLVGAIGAWYLAQTASQFLFGLEEHDLRAYVAAVVVLSLACLIATVVPARRAASVDPTVALRSE